MEVFSPEVSCQLSLVFGNAIFHWQGSCTTNSLDDHARDDFELGNLDDFDGSLLGTCDGFHVSTASAVVVHHSGTDPWRGDYVELRLGEDDYAYCPLQFDLPVHLKNSQTTVPCYSLGKYL